MDNEWQTSWSIFVDLLTECVQAGEAPESLVARFSGKRVAWTGRFQHADLDELSPNVYVDLPSRFIDLGDGRTTTVDRISLPVAEGSQASWSSLQAGAEIKFGAVMGRGKSPVPPISIKTFRSGKTMVTVRLSEGVLIG